MKLSQNSNKQVLALDIGATNTRIALIDGNLNILKSVKFPTPQANLLGFIKPQISELVADHLNVAGMGISVAGPINKDGSVRITNVVGKPHLQESDFRDLSEKNLIVNDATAAAYFEARANDTSNLAFITISSGIGVGIIKDAEIVRFHTTDDEIGHLLVPSDFALTCGCGKTNHWESYSSGINIPIFYSAWRKSKGLKPQTLEIKEIFRRAETGDTEATEFVVKILGNINSIAINEIINRYNPEVIILGGPVVLQNIDLFLRGLDPQVTKRSRLLFPSFDDEICLLGAAAYALDNLE